MALVSAGASSAHECATGLGFASSIAGPTNNDSDDSSPKP